MSADQNPRRELIRRLSEDSMGGIATLSDVTEAEQLVEAYRLAVIAARDAQTIEFLVKKAREEGRKNRDCRTRGDVLFRMADKISRGAIRPPLSKDADPDPVIDLTPYDQLFLKFALELAADEMKRRAPAFDAADDAAMESLRRLTGEAPRG